MICSKFQDKHLSLLGFGTMRLPTNPDGSIYEAQVRDMTRHAIGHGVNYFDTDYPYHNGDSERVIGLVLAEYPRGSFLSRHPISRSSDQQQGRSSRRNFRRSIEKVRRGVF